MAMLRLLSREDAGLAVIRPLARVKNSHRIFYSKPINAMEFVSSSSLSHANSAFQGRVSHLA
jgi:hypothetical protein